MSKELAAAAVDGLRAWWAADSDEGNGSNCGRYFRECVQHVYGTRYNALFDRARKTAIGYGEQFRSAGLAVAGPAVPGDALFKMSGCWINSSSGERIEAGHVGILVDGGQVAEASSVHGGRGTRTVAEFGHYDMVVRLPELAAPEPRLIIAAGAPNWWYKVAVADWETDHFEVDTEALCRMFGAAPLARSAMPIREALQAIGLTAAFEMEHLNDATNPRVYAFVTRA